MKLTARDRHELTELLRRLDTFDGSELHKDILLYLDGVRKQETGWLVDPDRTDTRRPDHELRAAISTRRSFNHAILFVQGMRTQVKRALNRPDPQEKS